MVEYIPEIILVGLAILVATILVWSRGEENGSELQ